MIKQLCGLLKRATTGLTCYFIMVVTELAEIASFNSATEKRLEWGDVEIGELDGESSLDGTLNSA